MRILIETKTSISLNKLSYEAFLSIAMILRYPNPLSFRLNNEAIIPKEYLSMTKYLVFIEAGFSNSRSEEYGKEGNLTQQKTRLRRESRTATRVVTSPEMILSES